MSTASLITHGVLDGVSGVQTQTRHAKLLTFYCTGAFPSICIMMKRIYEIVYLIAGKKPIFRLRYNQSSLKLYQSNSFIMKRTGALKAVLFRSSINLNCRWRPFLCMLAPRSEACHLIGPQRGPINDHGPALHSLELSQGISGWLSPVKTQHRISFCSGTNLKWPAS